MGDDKSYSMTGHIVRTFCSYLFYRRNEEVNADGFSFGVDIERKTSIDSLD